MLPHELTTSVMSISEIIILKYSDLNPPNQPAKSWILMEEESALNIDIIKLPR